MKRSLIFLFFLFFMASILYLKSQDLTAVYPKNGMQLHKDFVEFAWYGIDSALSYNLIIAFDENFTNIIEEINTSNKFSYNSINLSNGSYFWRIEALMSNGDILSSYIYSFTKFIPEQNGNLKLWLAADTAVVDSAGFVKEWRDISGNENHAVQNTINRRPQVIRNQNSFIFFDGENDAMTGTIIDDLYESSFSIFIVARNNAVSNARGVFSFGNYNGSGFGLIKMSAGSLGYYHKSKSFNSGNSNDCSPNGTPFRILSTTKDFNVKSTLYVNSDNRRESQNAEIISSFINTNYTIGYYAGVANYWDGDIA